MRDAMVIDSMSRRDSRVSHTDRHGVSHKTHVHEPVTNHPTNQFANRFVRSRESDESPRTAATK